MSDKLSVALYKVKEDVTFTNLEAILLQEKYEEQSLTITDSIWEIKVYYLKKHLKVKWKEFFKPIVDPAEAIIQSETQPSESAIIILERKDHLSQYCVVVGTAYFTVAEYVDPDFGIAILSRIITKDDRVLKSTREASLAGGIFGEIKFFRQNYNIYENENFGAFYQELKTIIDKDVLVNSLGFSSDDLKKDSLCIAKSSFKISKSIDFSQLLRLANGFESILSTRQPIEINSVRKLNRSVDKQLIRKLRIKLGYKLFQKYRQHPEAFNYDICHPDFEKYLTADISVVLKKKQKITVDIPSPITNIEDINTVLLNKDGPYAGFRDFLKNYITIYIETFDINGSILTRGNLAKHIMADIDLANQRYFYIEENWYLIRPEYIEQLNAECNAFIDAAYHSENLISWNPISMSENDYNASYVNQNSTLVLDKILVENIEMCDFCRWNDDTLYLYHAKIGLGNTMRDLCSQIFIAAQRLLRDINSGYEFIDKYYDAIKAKQSNDPYFKMVGQQANRISLDQFKNIFKKNIVFVLVVHEAVSRSRNIRNMSDFGSNIAKLSIAELFKNMKGIGVELQVVQI